MFWQGAFADDDCRSQSDCHWRGNRIAAPWTTVRLSPQPGLRRQNPLPVYLVLCLGWGLAAAFLSGCGSGDRGPERVVVSGTATYNGTPIADGRILFKPASTSHVPMTGAVIVDGKYRVDDKGGVPVGTQQIEIQAFRKIAGPLEPGEMAPPRLVRDGGKQQYLPNRFNANTQLEITIQPGSGEITKNFALTD